MEAFIKYIADDPLRILYLLGGSGGIWFWIKEWRSRTRIKVRLISETYDTGNNNFKVETTFEIENHGNEKTSLEPIVKFTALTPERETLKIELKVGGENRSLNPYEPKLVNLFAVCDARYPFTWFRVYEIPLTKGRTKKYRVLNSSKMRLGFISYIFGYWKLKLFNALPKKT